MFLRVLLKQLGESELLLALIILSLRTVRVFISRHLFVVVRTTTITTALSFPSRTVPIHFHLRFDLFERIFIVREEQFQGRIIFRLALFFVPFHRFFIPLLLSNRRRVVFAVANRARRRRRLLHVLSFLVNVNLLLLLFSSDFRTVVVFFFLLELNNKSSSKSELSLKPSGSSSNCIFVFFFALETILFTSSDQKRALLLMRYS